MKYSKLLKIYREAQNFCKVAYNGKRTQIKQSNRIIIEYVIDNCLVKQADSKYVAFVRTDNLGTKKYPYLYESLCIGKLSDYRETAFMLMPITDGCSKIYTSSIVGYLS